MGHISPKILPLQNNSKLGEYHVNFFAFIFLFIVLVGY